MKRIITAAAFLIAGATILLAQSDPGATSTPVPGASARPRPTARALPTDLLSRPRPDMSPIVPRAGMPTVGPGATPGGSSSVPGTGSGTGTGTGSGSGTGTGGTGTGSGSSTGGTGSSGTRPGTSPDR